MFERANVGGVSGRTGVFGSLCGLVFLINLSRVIYAPLLEPFRAEFTATAGGVGLLATLVWLGSAAPRIPTGYLLTRVARHRVILGTGALLATASTFAATAPTLEVLYVGAFAMGLASGAYFIAANPLVSELFPQRVGRALGVHGMAAQIAAVAAPLLVTGVFAVALWPIAAWRVVFLAIAAGAVLATAVLYAAARRTSLPAAGEADRNLLVALVSQWRIVATGIVFLGVAGFAWNGVFNFYVTYLVEAKGLTGGTARTLLMVVFATGIPAFLLGGRAADRLPYVPLLLAITAGFGTALLALTYAGSFLAIVAVTVVLGAVVHALFPAMDTYMLASLPDEHRASAYSLFSGTMMLLQATGSVAVGTLVDAGFDFETVFRGLAALIGAMLAIMIVAYALGRLPVGSHR